jgi:antibiotic biosynthesis monooxygenase (ABM) superfamily enzyme
MKKNKFQKPKKFTAIAKVVDSGAGVKFVKYRFNKIDLFITWIQSRYKVLFINFYSNAGENKRSQVASWGTRKGLEYL